MISSRRIKGVAPKKKNVLQVFNSSIVATLTPQENVLNATSGIEEGRFIGGIEGQVVMLSSS
jgi:hypothetical protein